MEWIIPVGVLMLLFVFLMAVSAAYSNGVHDGYGFSKEPNNPGYQKAASILQHSSHRWPELKDHDSCGGC